MSEQINQVESNHVNEQIPNFTLEKFKLNDRDKIVEFIIEVQVEFGLDLPIEYQPDLQNLETAYDALWVAKSGDKILGTIACMKLLNGDLVWKKWYVHKDYRKHGIGGKLIKELKDYAKKQGVINIWIGSIKEKFTSAVNFYSKIGGLEVSKDYIDKCLVDYPHNKVDNIFFRLPISLDPYQKYPTVPNFTLLQKMLKQKNQIDIFQHDLRNRLRNRMMSLALKLSLIYKSREDTSSHHKYKILDVLADVEKLKRLDYLVFESDKITESKVLIDFNQVPNSDTNLEQETVYLNIYLLGYSLESLKITKNQLKENLIIYDRVWLIETEKLIAKLEKILETIEVKNL